MERILIALYGRANIGKTATIRKAGAILLERHPHAVILKQDYVGRELHLVVKITGRVVVLLSQGDPGTNLDVRLEASAKLGAAVILCASRTRGMTVDAVNSLRNNYSVHWRNQPIAKPAQQESSNMAAARELVVEIEQALAA